MKEKVKEATEWLQDYFRINNMIFPIEKIHPHYSYWEHEVCSWELDLYSGVCKLVVEYNEKFRKIKFFTIIIPDTKEELFTLLNILEK